MKLQVILDRISVYFKLYVLRLEHLLGQEEPRTGGWREGHLGPTPKVTFLQDWMGLECLSYSGHGS